MRWTLTDGDTVFEIANGEDRSARVDGSHDGQMTQTTPTTVLLDDDKPTAFPDMATREWSFAIAVTFPECASLAEAFIQRLLIPHQCPAGGVLRGHINGDGIEFAQAWITVVPWAANGITNRFTFQITATGASQVGYWTDEFGEIFTDENDVPFSV